MSWQTPDGAEKDESGDGYDGGCGYCDPLENSHFHASAADDQDADGDDDDDAHLPGQ